MINVYDNKETRYIYIEYKIMASLDYPWHLYNKIMKY